MALIRITTRKDTDEPTGLRGSWSYLKSIYPTTGSFALCCSLATHSQYVHLISCISIKITGTKTTAADHYRKNTTHCVKRCQESGMHHSLKPEQKNKPSGCTQLNTKKLVIVWYKLTKPRGHARPLTSNLLDQVISARQIFVGPKCLLPISHWTNFGSPLKGPRNFFAL